MNLGSDIVLRLSDNLRGLVPLDLSDKAFSVSSHLLGAQNLHHVLGMFFQPGFGGFRVPYLLTMASDTSLLDASAVREENLPFVGMNLPKDYLTFTFYCSRALLSILLLELWSEHVLHDSDDLDRKLAAFRNSIPDFAKSSSEELSLAIRKISSYGTKLASFRGELGRVHRLWGSDIQKLAEQQHSTFQEIPVPPTNPGEIFFYRSLIQNFGQSGGLISMLAYSASSKLSLAKEAIEKQEEETSALQRHVSDLVGLKQTEINERLTVRIRRSTDVLVSLTAILIAVQIYLYLNPVSSKLGATTVYALMAVSVLSGMLGMIFGLRSFLGRS